MNNNKKAFSLVVAMGLVLITSLLAYTMLEYIVPFAKNIKGIENSTMAYYQANSGIEEGLYHFSNRTDLKDEGGTNYSGQYTHKYVTYSSGSLLPRTGEGNSEFDSDWNTISAGNPIQLFVGKQNIDWNNAVIKFRIPDLDDDGNNLDVTLLDGNPLFPMINWQLSSQSNTINAYTGYLISINEINGADIDLDFLQGIDLYGTHGSSEIIPNFHNSYCTGTGSGCSLKFSIINKLESDIGTVIPYLEWQIDFDPLNTGSINKKVPLRYSKIFSSGKSYGFKKDLEIRIPQKTVSEAFDFTVFQ